MNLAIFASGNGTNAENIIKFFSKKTGGNRISVKVLFCNNPQAGVIQRARDLNVPVVVLPNREMLMQHNDNHLLLDLLNFFKIDAIVLAGYLLKIPNLLVRIYPNKIINIHPALLPRFGGKGMYGDNVHKAVISSGEEESGITVHLVDDLYDNGRILFQAKCRVFKNETVESLAEKIHILEQEHFPTVIENYFLNN